jgi:hypothetical protein
MAEITGVGQHEVQDIPIHCLAAIREKIEEFGIEEWSKGQEA